MSDAPESASLEEAASTRAQRGAVRDLDDARPERGAPRRSPRRARGRAGVLGTSGVEPRHGGRPEPHVTAPVLMPVDRERRRSHARSTERPPSLAREPRGPSRRAAPRAPPPAPHVADQQARLRAFNALAMALDGFYVAFQAELSDRRPPPDSSLPLAFLRRDARALQELARRVPPVGPFSVEQAADALRLAARIDDHTRHPPLVAFVRAVDLMDLLVGFRHAFADLRRLAGIEEARTALERREREEEERQRAEAAEREWVQAIETDGATLRVGDVAHPWRIVRLHRSGFLLAVHVEDAAREQRFSFRDWFFQLTVAGTVARTLDVARASTPIQFVYGVLEGAGQQVEGMLHPLFHFEELLSALRTALSDLPGTARAVVTSLFEALRSWIRRFVDGASTTRARMLGRLIGMLLVEILVARGAGLVLGAARRALTALRSTRGIGAVIVAVERSAHAARAFASGMSRAVVDRLMAVGLIRHAVDFVGDVVDVGRAVLEYGGQLYRGALCIAGDALRFIADGAEGVLIHIGRSLDDWAFGELTFGASNLGADAADRLLQQAWRRYRDARARGLGRRRTTSSAPSPGSGTPRFLTNLRAMLRRHGIHDPVDLDRIMRRLEGMQGRMSPAEIQRLVEVTLQYRRRWRTRLDQNGPTFRCLLTMFDAGRGGRQYIQTRGAVAELATLESFLTRPGVRRVEIIPPRGTRSPDLLVTHRREGIRRVEITALSEAELGRAVVEAPNASGQVTRRPAGARPPRRDITSEALANAIARKLGGNSQLRVHLPDRPRVPAGGTLVVRITFRHEGLRQLAIDAVASLRDRLVDDWGFVEAIEIFVPGRRHPFRFRRGDGWALGSAL